MYTYGAGSPGTYRGMGTSIALPPMTGVPGTSPAPGYSYDEGGNLISLAPGVQADEEIDISVETTALTPALPSKLLPPAEQGGVTQLAPAGATVTFDPRSVPVDIVNRGAPAVEAYKMGKGTVSLASSIVWMVGVYRLIRRRPGGWKWFLGGTALYFAGGPAGRAAAALNA